MLEGELHMEKIKIQLIKEEEIPIVHRLMLEAFEEYRNLDVPSSALSETVEGLADAIHNDTEQAILCYLDEEPCGCARFQLKEDYLYFSRLSVTPRARGRKVATAMISWLEGLALESKKSRLTCKVRSSLPKNIRLYEKLGFILLEEEVITNPNGFLVKTASMEKSI